MELWNKFDQTQKPDLKTIGTYVNNPLWEKLCSYVEAEYQCKPLFEYSRCSLQKGWNVKYKKAGRTLCTLYPMEGNFIALIVIGENERTETEFLLPCTTPYMQKLYQETQLGIGQKWLMIHVTNEDILMDLKQLITIRRGGNYSHNFKDLHGLLFL